MAVVSQPITRGADIVRCIVHRLGGETNEYVTGTGGVHRGMYERLYPLSTSANEEKRRDLAARE